MNFLKTYNKIIAEHHLKSITEEQSSIYNIVKIDPIEKQVAIDNQIDLDQIRKNMTNPSEEELDSIPGAILLYDDVEYGDQTEQQMFDIDNIPYSGIAYIYTDQPNDDLLSSVEHEISFNTKDWF